MTCGCRVVWLLVMDDRVNWNKDIWMKKLTTLHREKVMIKELVSASACLLSQLTTSNVVWFYYRGDTYLEVLHKGEKTCKIAVCLKNRHHQLWLQTCWFTVQSIVIKNYKHSERGYINWVS